MQSSSRAVGLPSGPGRARSRTRNEPDRPHDRAPSLPRQVRPQKSAPSIRRERSIAPPVPRQHAEPSHHRSADTESYRSSHDSASSVSSRSLFDHARSGSGYASSVTSYEDDDYRRGSSKSQSLRTRRAQQSTATDSYGPGPLPSSLPVDGIGGTIWNRVATAASALTVNVGKAWAANITTMSGEETPPGEESRLTRAMKAYHLEKARDRSDLPAWLFDEHERMPKLRVTEAPLPTRAEERTTKPRCLRDIYESAAATPIVSARKSEQYNPYLDDPTPSKATDRLKALRDAKRTALRPQHSNNHSDVQVGDDRTVVRNVQSDGQRQRGRIGLPSGPGISSRTRRHYQ